MPVAIAILTLASLLLFACDEGSTETSCSTVEDCPTGQACFEGSCVIPLDGSDSSGVDTSDDGTEPDSKPDLADPGICRQGLEHFLGCGYVVADFETRLQADHEKLVRMEAGDCARDLACYAACMLADQGDDCMECHFGERDCFRDPFGECIQACPQQLLCEDTGGSWGNSECENCCGPPACGSNPFEPCTDPCCGPPQCYCPESTPFWDRDRGCFEDESCYP